MQPDGAEVVPTESTTWYGDTPWPTSGPGTGAALTGGRNYRYVEERIYEHERLYVLGDFRSTRIVRRAATRRPRLAQLLAEWKQDQPALIERFDQDGDGRIDLERVGSRTRRRPGARSLQRGAERPARQNLPRARAARTATGCS